MTSFCMFFNVIKILFIGDFQRDEGAINHSQELSCSGQDLVFLCPFASPKSTALQRVREKLHPVMRWMFTAFSESRSICIARRSTSRAQTSPWFDVCISIRLPNATHNTFNKLIISQYNTTSFWTKPYCHENTNAIQILLSPATRREIITEFSV